MGSRNSVVSRCLVSGDTRVRSSPTTGMPRFQAPGLLNEPPLTMLILESLAAVTFPQTSAQSLGSGGLASKVEASRFTVFTAATFVRGEVGKS